MSKKKKIFANVRFKFRSDTLKNWETNNPVLLEGEVGVVTGLNLVGDGLENKSQKIKFGDGIHDWKSLGWWNGPKGEDSNIIIDEIFSSESGNVQSGTAIAGALAKCLSVDGETEWIFDGGDSETSVSVVITVDNQVSNLSNNPISNKAIKEYVDKKAQEIITNFNDKNVDYIVEQAQSNNGIYRKWNSGIAECWKRLEISNMARNIMLNGIYYTPEISLGNFPSGLFISEPYICDISLLNPEFSSLVETGSKVTTKDIIGSVYLASTIAKESMYATICIYAMGYWK